MELKIKWSAEAERTYQNILTYLENEWTEREVNAFVKRADALLKVVVQQPYAFKPSSRKSIRKAVVGKQNSLFYRINGTTILLLYFWDNRQNPTKSKY